MIDIKTLSIIVGSVVAIAALFKGLHEYSRNSRMKRAEYFLEQRGRLKSDQILHKISMLIELKDPALEDVSFSDKLLYTGFFEEIAILMNSGLIKKQIAFYMFGYYAIRMWDSEVFWSDLNRDMTYWAVLRDFVDQMRFEEMTYSYSRSKYKL